MPRGTDLTKYGELRMVAEYVRSAYPDASLWMRLRLGTLIPDHPRPDMTPEEEKMSGVFRRWADAVVVTGSELIVIEGSMRSETGKPSQLAIYGLLVPHTPDLKEHLHLRLVLEMVVAIEDPVVSAYARKQGIRTTVYEPDWLPLWRAQLHRRERRPMQARGLRTGDDPAPAEVTP